MPNYTGIQKEETLKGMVYNDFFSAYGYEPNIDNIDFVITDKKARGDLFSDGPGSSRHYLWAEAKKGAHDVFDMFTQLILTCKKTYEKGDHLAPPWLGVFDEARIAFVPFHDILPVFTETDINWNQTPHNHETTDFQKARRAVEKLIGAKIAVYNFGADDREIKEFIKTHFTDAAGGTDGAASIKFPITKDNFVQIFIKWIKEVKPFINISKEKWQEFKKIGVLDGDFFRADMMSAPAARELGENCSSAKAPEPGIFSTTYSAITLTDKLKIILENDKYKYHQVFEGDLFSRVIDFTDDGEAYRRFWNKYERPPAEQYQKYIIERPDLLVPQNIRETKGSFFTPRVWVEKSREYLEKAFGKNWQEEYYIWDCAAGTGNLLAGLSNKYNVWASTIDETDVNTINTLIDIDDNLDLLPAHVFQFDFLNDGFDKLPEELRKIIDDPEKRKKLIIYINPPYSETMSKTGTDKTGLNKTMVNTKYKLKMGNSANRELFVQFLTRIYFEIPDCKIGEFSTLKTLEAPNFIDFRKYFKADLLAMFVVPAETFDNVNGKFTIGFKIWDTGIKKIFESIVSDVYSKGNVLTGTKIIRSYDDGKFINDWIISTRNREHEKPLGFMSAKGNDFQNQNFVYIVNDKAQLPVPRGSWVTDKNIVEVCIYLSVRHCIDATWLNNRDQFLFPNDGWKTDVAFQNDCLIFALFHAKNAVQSNYGTNHWIPFTEKEVDAKEKFESSFMSKYLKDKTFSPESQTVLDAGLELWKYYHAKIKNNNTVSVNASFYDIREFFQGRKESGNMNVKSADETYNALIGKVRDAQKALAAKIAPKVYEYGFLKE